MKKIALGLTLCLMATIAVGQTQSHTVRVHSGGNVVYSAPTSGNNRIGFGTAGVTFSHNGESWSSALEGIDSLTFVSGTSEEDHTESVDTAGAVRITWNGSNVTVVNPLASNGVTVNTSQGHVSITSTIEQANIPYILKGTSTNGSLSLTSAKKVYIVLDGLTLTSNNGPAIWVNSDVKALVEIKGENSLSDSESNSRKGALQCAGKLAIQGDGTLQVSGKAKHAIQSSGRCTMSSGTVQVLTAEKDGLNVDDFIMYGGTLQIANPNGDGLDGDQGLVAIYGGEIDINCSAGDVKGIGCDSTLTIAGGVVNVTVSGNQSKGLKTKQDLFIAGSTLTVNANGSYVSETVDGEVDLSYCTGAKVGGSMWVYGGESVINCGSSNAGGRAVSCDGNFVMASGILTLTATGDCGKYLVSGSTYDSYASTCLKVDGNVGIGGGVLGATAGGRGIRCDGTYAQSGGAVSITTSAAGFTTVGSGTSCTDGFAPSCLKSDSDISITGGTFSGISTGKGGRGIVADGKMNIGTIGGSESDLHLYLSTSGTAVNASSGGWGGWGGNSSQWKGLPKGIKIQGNINIMSGTVQSYCAQTSGDPTGEAIETKDTLFIQGGSVEANAYDDAINAASHIAISGGRIWAYARGNDGIDCNGNNIKITGGTIIAYGTECGIDDNADNGGTHLYISNATMVVVGGNMGAIEGTPSLTGQKYLVLGASNGGWGGGGSNGLTLARNGFCIKNSNGDETITFKMPTLSGSGFEEIDALLANTKRVSGVFITTPDIESGNYTYYTSPTISGGSSWHGLYTNATVTTSGNGTTATAR